ncbi:MAG: C39 family peptidase [Patescibacteria group bacterium]
MNYFHNVGLMFVGIALLTSSPAAALTKPAPEVHTLAVPHIWEIPDGKWVPPWSGACEEVSVVMVERFYLKDKTAQFTPAQTKAIVGPLFPWENKQFGSNIDTDATRTARMMNDFSSAEATIVWNPTLAAIKDELRAGRPVISMHYGYDMNNPRHRFRQGSSSYHVVVLAGFDDAKQEFLVNDSEFKDGRHNRYAYSTIMNSLHDFDHKTRKANGKPVVLFTSPKRLVKTASDPKVYLVRNNTRFHIASMDVLRARRIELKNLEIISDSALTQIPEGAAITK